LLAATYGCFLWREVRLEDAEMDCRVAVDERSFTFQGRLPDPRGQGFPSMTVTRAEFGKKYSALIEGRTFVEYKDYYRNSINRYWNSFDRIQRLGLPKNASVIDIGGGIMAVLLSKILGLNACVGDVNRRSAEDVEGHGIRFLEVDLLSENQIPQEQFDLVILQEVIEHLPLPPYIVLKRLSACLKPEGIVFITTPNGSRLRNILYMLMGKQVLDNFRYPVPGEALGHQHEYTLPELLWQFEHIGMPVVFSQQCDDGWMGASRTARVAHMLAKPANLIPHLRSGLMIAAQRRPQSGPESTHVLLDKR
jgi:SAM-dependent methyltransferase